MDEKKFLTAYHEAIQERLSDEISLLMQNWHRELAVQFAEQFGITQQDAFETMESEYLHRGYVTLEFLPDEDELYTKWDNDQFTIFRGDSS
jgi:hypothetical protein